MRQLSRASGAALLVPVAVVGSMGLLALAGGFGALGGLGQALSGPALPGNLRSATPLAATSGKTAKATPLLAVISSPPPTLVASVKLPSGPARGGNSASPNAGHGPGGTNGTGPGTSTPPPTGTSTPTGPSTPPPAAPPSSGSPPVTRPQPPPTLIEGVVSLGTSITSKLPAPVGQLATTALQDVGQTVDRVLPGQTSSTGSASTGVVSGVTGAVGSTVSHVQSGVGALGAGVSGLLHGTRAGR
jgi:hypothetical protein